MIGVKNIHENSWPNGIYTASRNVREYTLSEKPAVKYGLK